MSKKKDPDALRAAEPEARPFPTAYLDMFLTMPCGICGKKGCKKHQQAIGARCHPRQPLGVEYLDGFLYLCCSLCREPLFKVAIEPMPERPSDE